MILKAFRKATIERASECPEQYLRKGSICFVFWFPAAQSPHQMPDEALLFFEISLPHGSESRAGEREGYKPRGSPSSFAKELFFFTYSSLVPVAEVSLITPSGKTLI